MCFATKKTHYLYMICNSKWNVSDDQYYMLKYKSLVRVQDAATTVICASKASSRCHHYWYPLTTLSPVTLH